MAKVSALHRYGGTCHLPVELYFCHQVSAAIFHVARMCLMCLGGQQERDVDRPLLDPAPLYFARSARLALQGTGLLPIEAATPLLCIAGVLAGSKAAALDAMTRKRASPAASAIESRRISGADEVNAAEL